MLFAQDTGLDTWHLVTIGGFVGVIVSAVVGAAVTLLTFWVKTRKESRADAILEWQTLLEKERTLNESDKKSLRDQNAGQQEQINSLQARINTVQSESNAKIDAVRAENNSRTDVLLKALNDCHTEHVDDVKKIGEMDKTIGLMQVQLRMVQSSTGTAIPHAESSSVIVVNLRGIITVSSPALVSILGWTPKELEGKPVEVLVPARFIEKHRAGFAKAKATGFGMIDTARTIDTFALDRNGHEVPVSITLKPWQSDNKDDFVTASIKQRIVDTSEMKP